MKRESDLTKSQLFLDDLWIEEQHKLTRLWHPADIYPEPVLIAAAKAEEEDKATLTGLLGGELLRAPGLDVPAEYLESFERGELSAQEVIEIVEALETRKKAPNTNIEVEEDRIIIGDQQLEVDL